MTFQQQDFFVSYPKCTNHAELLAELNFNYSIGCADS